MKTSRLLWAVLFSLALVSAAFPQVKHSPEVVAIEQVRIKALTDGDYVLLEKMLADDLVYIHSSGVVDNKKTFLESLKSGAVKYETLTESEITLRSYGTTAVLTGKARLQLQSKGQALNFDIRFTALYVKNGPRWQLASWQSTRLPA